MGQPTGRLASVDYRPPNQPSEVRLTIVTPTWNRPDDLVRQATLIGEQMTRNDRWIIVDDASPTVPNWRTDIVPKLPSVDQIMIVPLVYAKGERTGTVNRARAIGCELAELDTWIVEVDDHDYLLPGALDTVRQTIVAGATFVYGDVLPIDRDGNEGHVFRKPDYAPWLLRDRMCPCEGVRAFPAWLYHAVGGYRWRGPIGVNQNEFPGGDYGLFLRMELFCEGQGFYHVSSVLNLQPKIPGAISVRNVAQQADMAQKLRLACKRGTLDVPWG